ncbi:MAG: carbohydrate kinase family protein, partial [Gammaproteobacteria bacterium]
LDPSGLIRTLLDEGKALVVCTHGARGAEAHTAEGEQVFQPAEPVTQVVDTNGAGDAFFAGFLAAHLDGQPVAACMERGARQAALCVQSEALVG